MAETLGLGPAFYRTASMGETVELASNFTFTGTMTFSGAVTCSSNLTVNGNLVFGDLSTDTITITGLATIATNQKLQFRDTGIYLNSSADGILNIVSDTTIAMSGAITMDSTLTMTGKIALGANGGAASASGLLMGIGTSGSPATSAVADAKFVEIRAQSTAASGDNRLMYLRYDLNGGGGGESLRTFTKITASTGTARGAHISLDMGNTSGAITGLGAGVDAQLLMGNTAYSAGTFAALNAEIYSDGTSTDVSGITDISFIRCVAGGDGTGAANVDDNAFFASFSGLTAGSANIIDTDITTHTAYGGLKVNIPGVGTRWLALVSA